MTPEEQLVAEIRAEIAKLSADDQLKVECMVTTLKGILKLGGRHAQLAFALLGAQMACD